MKVPLNEYLIQDEAAIPGYDLIDSLFNITTIMESKEEHDRDVEEQTLELTDDDLKRLPVEKLRGKLTVEQLKQLLTDIKVSSMVIPEEYIISVWTMMLFDITSLEAATCAEVSRRLLYDSIKERGDVKLITLYLFKEFIKYKKVP